MNHARVRVHKIYAYAVRGACSKQTGSLSNFEKMTAEKCRQLCFTLFNGGPLDITSYELRLDFLFRFG